MAAARVSLDQVMESTSGALDAGLLQFSSASVIGTGGFVETPNQRLTVSHVQPIVTSDALSRSPFPRRRRGRPLAAWRTWWSTTSRSPGTP
jgi:hypothetical protein